MVLPAMNRAVAVCSGVRTVLVAEPTALTSLKSAVYVGTRHGRRGPGRNWLGESSSSGRSWDSHGSKNGANAGGGGVGFGVGRQTPGPSGTSKVIGRETAVVLAQLDEAVGGALAVVDPLHLRRPIGDRGE